MIPTKSPVCATCATGAPLANFTGATLINKAIAAKSELINSLFCATGECIENRPIRICATGKSEFPTEIYPAAQHLSTHCLKIEVSPYCSVRAKAPLNAALTLMLGGIESKALNWRRWETASSGANQPTKMEGIR